MAWSGTPSTRQSSQRGIAIKSGTRDKAEGKWHQVKGKVKEIAGDFSDDSNLKAGGQKEGRTGEIQEKIGEIKKVVDK
jgi:uncharacterized protein YjbJ (UPF0337 family)